MVLLENNIAEEKLFRGKGVSREKIPIDFLFKST